MARNKTIKFLRTTRANLNTQKNGNGLLEGEPYLITDENRIAIGIANNNYEDLAKKSEVDSKKNDNVSATSRILGRKSSGAGVMEELTLSEVMDFIGSATSGDILYRGASTWARLPKGSDGQILTLASGIPSWAAASGGNSERGFVLTSSFLTNSGSYVDVTNFLLSVSANKKYRISIFLSVGYSTDTGLYQLTAPSGSLFSGGSVGSDGTTSLGNSSDRTTATAYIGMTSCLMKINGLYYLETGGSSGNVQLQTYLSWGTYARVFKGSFMTMMEIP